MDFTLTFSCHWSFLGLGLQHNSRGSAFFGGTYYWTYLPRVVHGTSPSEGPGGPLVRRYRLKGGPLLVNLGLTAQMVKGDLPCPPRMPRVQYVIQNSEEYS